MLVLDSSLGHNYQVAAAVNYAAMRFGTLHHKLLVVRLIDRSIASKCPCKCMALIKKKNVNHGGGVNGSPVLVKGQTGAGVKSKLNAASKTSRVPLVELYRHEPHAVKSMPGMKPI